MKTALITTTIHVPRVLELLRAYGPDVRFFIAGDQKTPHADLIIFCAKQHDALYLPPEAQKRWKFSEITGWNCIQRRNAALLEAIAWGADQIITWDTDNLSIDACYFKNFERLLTSPYTGLCVSSPTKWHSVYADPLHRGFPLTVQNGCDVDFVVDGKVGVAAGIVIGDPDVNAYARLGRGFSDINMTIPGIDSYVVNPNTKTVFNSQNTAFLRAFAPAMFMAPGIGRFDDIVASLLTQRLMRAKGYHVHFGRPFAYQQRNPHNYLVDVQQEMWGYEHLLEIADYLDAMTFGALTFEPMKEFVLTACRYFYGGCAVLPQQTREAALAFMEDIEGLL